MGNERVASYALDSIAERYLEIYRRSVAARQLT
jgi:hypothetical protein